MFMHLLEVYRLRSLPLQSSRLGRRAQAWVFYDVLAQENTGIQIVIEQNLLLPRRSQCLAWAILQMFLGRVLVCGGRATKTPSHLRISILVVRISQSFFHLQEAGTVQHES